jgi:photosystem II stability/assembly factor-like uncharacterized protein
MNRFTRVVQILDNSVGGPTAPAGPHGAFWRGVSRDAFVGTIKFGLQLIIVGDGTGSNLVKALKGETPFGADSGNPDADFNRMPSGQAPVAPADIAFIEKWINEGCLEDAIIDVSPLSWRKTNAPTAGSRTDDIWFVDPNIGWAVNSDGKILKTTDGGDSWIEQKSMPGVYLRCVGFADANIGWVGTLTRNKRLMSTKDGGTTWNAVLPVPDLAPVAVCGISVVSDKIVYCSGTNRPSDFPRMMKTTDGGVTWTAWDMSPHASILIDCYFRDSLHGWVVGGKSTEPTPTTRDKVKPVVLETTDGGLTWTNRLAGQEALFPPGEWGWKIQFLNSNPQIGYVSLENFTDAAILKTTDGGITWKRLKVNDPQGNANLEGIGFIDEQQGWVGGWGSTDFSKGFTSVTTDGGNNWASSNEVGRFLNRFRFFGDPVQIGYASGDTVYKYSSAPIPPSAQTFVASLDLVRSILPETHLLGRVGNVSLQLNIPPMSKRLTVRVWNRFGEDVGVVIDEVRPAAGPLQYSWDGIDSQGKPVSPGDYIVRVTVDDVSVSSLLHIAQSIGHSESGASVRRSPPRMPRGVAQPPRLTTIRSLVKDPKHDLDWLKNALQIAIQLELSTLPPYLVAQWTIQNPTESVVGSIHQIRNEEMLHFGLACNMLAAIDGVPLLADSSVVPKYPGPLPGGVRPGLVITLRKLDTAQAKVFMDIEYPEDGPIATLVTGESPVTIGEFYDSILNAFKTLNPTLSTSRQIKGPLTLFWVDTLAKVEEAINLIKVQGEGSNVSPEEQTGDLAHYYRFGEIAHEKHLIKNSSGKWVFEGDPFPIPAVYPMLDIPTGGYQQADVPDIAIWDSIQRFDRRYSDMLLLLQEAWTHGDRTKLNAAVSKMFEMGSIGADLVTKPHPSGTGNYGPCFRFVN